LPKQWTEDPDRKFLEQAHADCTFSNDAGEILASAVKIKCKFDTLSGVMAQENIQSIGLLKIDAELADWEILNGVKTEVGNESVKSQWKFIWNPTSRQFLSS
jgi:hypothetical protein